MKTVFFGYSQIGHDGLQTLFDLNVDVALVVTHQNNPGEHIWFDSVETLARKHNIPVITPDSPNAPDVVSLIQSLQPDWIISMYYRQLISDEILNIPPKGAMNMHGSLLPRYRGRSPVNWAILNGETKTGATLHYMTSQPDAGDIVDQICVSIEPEDNAQDVTKKVNGASQEILKRQVPLIENGVNARTPQDNSQASYFGKRTIEDGLISNQMSALQIHNLIRAVTPYPQYPGGLCIIKGKTYKILRSWLEEPPHKNAIVFTNTKFGETIFLEVIPFN
jgi:methionyl-tRNA formyltransferase